MQIQGIKIQGYVRLDNSFLMKGDTLEDFALRCIERGKELALKEYQEKNTFLDKGDLQEYFNVSLATLRRWKKEGHPKFGQLKFTDSYHMKMVLADAKELRNQILGI